MNPKTSGTLPDKAQSTERIEALSDGIFGVALTLLVLDIKVPDVPNTQNDVASAVVHLLPRIGSYVASFLIVGYTWIWHHLTFAIIERSSRVLMWINLILLLAIGFLPFSTALIAKYTNARAAMLTYGVNVLWFSVTLNILLAYAVRAGLVSKELGSATVAASERRGYLQTLLTIIALVVGVAVPYAGIAGFMLIAVFYIATGSRHSIVDPKRQA